MVQATPRWHAFWGEWQARCGWLNGNRSVHCSWPLHLLAMRTRTGMAFAPNQVPQPLPCCSARWVVYHVAGLGSALTVQLLQNVPVALIQPRAA